MQHRATAVASRALELALRGKSFRVRDVQRGLSDPPSRQTVYRVLQQLEADDWIRVDGHSWHPDIKSQMLADVDEGTDRDGRRGLGLDTEDLLGERVSKESHRGERH